jgi:signal transduction histidine kinase
MASSTMTANLDYRKDVQLAKAVYGAISARSAEDAVRSPQLDDGARLRAMQQAGLLDAPPEDAFDRLTRLAARSLGVPISLVSLVDANRQFFKSSIGLPEPVAAARQTPLSHSFCKHVVLSGEPLVVSDARLHPVLKDNPAIGMGVVAYAGYPLATQDGLVLGSFCAIDSSPREWTAEQLEILHDLTSAAMTEIELRRSNYELRRANQAKDRFIAMLSHDLRTPLSPALLTAAEMVQDPALPESFRDDVKLILRNIESEVRMIDSLLDVTHIATGKLRLDLESLDAHELLQSSVEMCAPDALAKSVSLRMDLRATHTGLSGDATKLLQAICNLLKNAIKFSGPGGCVTVRTSDGGAQRLRIDINDTGIGISPEALPHIFDAFEQGDSAATQRFGGLGLGLAICDGIVKAHGGTVSAASDGAGKGSTMTMLLPLAADAKPVSHRESVAAKEGSQSALKILLVEDHEDSLRAMLRLLRRLGHEITTATGVTTALRAASESDFDLLISDLGLPDGTGLQLMKELLGKRPIKGIALTGYGMESDIQQTRQAGFQKHLTKPINLQELQAAIQEVA